MTKRIGIITNNAQGVFQRLVIAGVRAEAEAQGIAVTVDAQDEHADRRIALDPASVDGLLVIANCAPESWLAKAHKQVPVTLVSHTVNLPIPSVFFNNAQGIRELMYHLIVECGCQQPLFIRGVRDQTDAIERETAYRDELMRYHLDADTAPFIDGAFEADIAADALAAALEQGVRFDAVVSADYLMAIEAMAVLRGRGVAVPQDVAVVGFGDAIEAAQAQLTTVAANVEELGHCGALQLLHQMNGYRIQGKTLLSVEIVVRQTTLPR